MYRIESETSFTEVQRLGSRYLVHSIKALTWPERLRIADMLGNVDGTFVAATEAEFVDGLRQAERT